MDYIGTESNFEHNTPQRPHNKEKRSEGRYRDGRIDEEPSSPVLTLWPRLSEPLREALYGAICQHGIVSTRKAIAAIRGVDEDVRAFLSRLDKIAPGAQTVPPSQDSVPRTAPPLERMPMSFRCSSCVDAAARSFLSDVTDGSGLSVVDTKAFFVRLVRVSTGEFMHWWREAGLTDDVVSSHLLGVSTELVGTRSESIEKDDAAEAEKDYIVVD